MAFGAFSKRDKKKIVKLVRERGRQPLNASQAERRRQIPAGPSYIVKLHAELPAATGTTTITAGTLADCVAYTRNTTTNVLEASEATVPVYNLGAAIASGEYIQCVRIAGDLIAINSGGAWIVASLDSALTTSDATKAGTVVESHGGAAAVAAAVTLSNPLSKAAGPRIFSGASADYVIALLMDDGNYKIIQKGC